MAKSKTIKISKNLLILSAIILGLIAITIINLLSNYFRFLRNAHSTFERYYAFRGCVQLIQKTDTQGTCKTDDGKIIKIVEFKGRWYLDGDLPVCYGNLCF